MQCGIKISATKKAHGNVTVNAISFAGVGLYHYCAVGCSLYSTYACTCACTWLH